MRGLYNVFHGKNQTGGILEIRTLEESELWNSHSTLHGSWFNRQRPEGTQPYHPLTQAQNQHRSFREVQISYLRGQFNGWCRIILDKLCIYVSYRTCLRCVFCVFCVWTVVVYAPTLLYRTYINFSYITVNTSTKV